MENLADTFRMRRLALGLSLAEAAAAAKLSVRTVTNFEAGRHGISLPNLRRLLSVVDLDLGTQPRAAHRSRKPAPRKARSTRPGSLAEAARRGASEDRRDAMIREFCDEFYKAGASERGAMLAKEPAIQGGEADAYYGAIAEHLALQNGLPVPRWALAEKRFLHKPFFPARLESLKSTLLVESPVAFRRRMIFVGPNPLSRPPRSL